MTGDIYIPKDLAKGVVRTGTWATASSTYWVKKTLLSNGIEKIITDASGSYAIPSGFEVGQEITVRKINATQGTITISCEDTNEKFTPSLINNVYLNADGDFWRFKKITSTRWDLVEGHESSRNSNGYYKRTGDGSMECHLTGELVEVPANSTDLFTKSFAKSFSEFPSVHVEITSNNAVTDISLRLWSYNTLDEDGYDPKLYYRFTLTNTWSSCINGTRYNMYARGRWY